MKGTAVNTTVVPVQTLLALGLIDNVGTTDGFTVIVMPEEVAVVTVAQAALDVTCTVTMSPLFNEPELKLLLLVPASMLFTFH